MRSPIQRDQQGPNLAPGSRRMELAWLHGCMGEGETHELSEDIEDGKYRPASEPNRIP